MKTMIYGVIAILLLQISLVSATGVSGISPRNLELMPGEAGRFTFQIQSVATPRDLNCVYGVDGRTPLLVEFDQASTDITAGTVKDILGTITVPKELGYGTYDLEMCAHCAYGTQEVTNGQSPVRWSSCGLKTRVEVVSERSRQNMPLPQKPQAFEAWKMVAIVTVIVIVIAGVIWAYARRKDKKASKKKK